MTDATKDEQGLAKTERIAKRIARAGIASRREAERMIAEGRVTVDGNIISSPALDVGPETVITIDGKPLPKPERTKIWRYHKPRERLVSRSDPQGRPTIYADLPPELAHAIAVGRLDFNSEGLLLLTNDGELARKLELPSEGVARHYRARAFGHIDQKALDRLAEGITVEGVHYGPIEAKLEEARGANVWIALSLSEGKNREIRRVLEAIGLKVNRLIRTSYGPFHLGDLPSGAVTEVSGASMVRDVGISDVKPKGWAKAKPKKNQRPGKNARIAFRNKEGEQRRAAEMHNERNPGHKPGDRRPSGKLHKARPHHPNGNRPDGNRPGGDRASESRPGGNRPDGNRADGNRPWRNKTGDERRPSENREQRNERRPDERRPSGNMNEFRPKRPDGSPGGHRPNGNHPRGNRPSGNRPGGNRSGGRPSGGRGKPNRPGSGADRRR
jgi:23S rRNA pseudouridine2605 synthase